MAKVRRQMSQHSLMNLRPKKSAYGEPMVRKWVRVPQEVVDALEAMPGGWGANARIAIAQYAGIDLQQKAASD